ncbi:MAG TPA: phosphoribosylamine--glycine ligase [Leptospiraceae bacterium]|nr:phosphoribosylamine--glycine ligase [Leptospiraceae bacterium]HMZ60759.1 phosphoribosylamine--glycine ligase [Leptospiraceae bacterium]
MKVLLIGSGGRESAIAWQIRKSPLLSLLKVYPGNAGFPDSEIVLDGPNLKSKESVQNFVRKEKFDFVIAGPEEPLVDGICDWLSEMGIPCFGPSAYCAQLEGSKDFAKKLMKDFGIPTAEYSTFTDYHSAIEYIKKRNFPIVIKADGLAAGKGVTVSPDFETADRALKEAFLESRFGKSGERVVIEDFLSGEEASLFAVCDGENFLCFPAAQDHKRAYDGDNGPNTGGMGAYAPAPIADESVIEKAKNRIISPMLEGLKKSGHPYRGLLYAGLMIDANGDPYVVEFNCRFGDPETQALMLLCDSDLLDIMYNAASGSLLGRELKMKKEFSAVVVLAAEGYPDEYAKGMEIQLPDAEGFQVQIFMAGVQKKDGKTVSSGGRILGIAASAETPAKAVELAYRFLALNRTERTYYRKDIAHKAAASKISGSMKN